MYFWVNRCSRGALLFRLVHCCFSALSKADFEQPLPILTTAFHCCSDSLALKALFPQLGYAFSSKAPEDVR